MANVWLDAAAPYVLVVAVGAVGWIVNTSVTDLKSLNLVEYEIGDSIANGQPVKTVDIYNRSLMYELASGDFTFHCRDTSKADCFGKSEHGLPIKLSRVGGVVFPSEPKVDGINYKATARLAPQSSVRYEITVSSPYEDVVVMYNPDTEKQISAGLIFRQGESWEGWLIANYLSYLVRFLLVLLGLLTAWFAAALLSLGVGWYRTGDANVAKKEPETFKIIVEKEGGTA